MASPRHLSRASLIMFTLALAANRRSTAYGRVITEGLFKGYSRIIRYFFIISVNIRETIRVISVIRAIRAIRAIRIIRIIRAIRAIRINISTSI